MLQTKETNPKEAVGSTRLPLHLIPDGPLGHVSLAFYEGAVKYEAYNWRTAGVRASTYVAAARRHIGKWWNGDDCDPDTKVHHLANAAACLMIMLDAEIQGKLNDDRPVRQDLQNLYKDLAGVQQHLYATLNKTPQAPELPSESIAPGPLSRYRYCKSCNNHVTEPCQADCAVV